MKVNGNLDLQGNMLRNVRLEPVTSWPSDPKPGTFIFKDKRIFVCLSIDEAVPVWLPVSAELHTHVHDQFEAQSEWIIEHHLQTQSAIVQIYNSENKVIECDEIEQSYNLAVIRFAVPQAGRAVLVFGATQGIPRQPDAYQQQYSEESVIWVVSHGLGYAPIIRAFSGQLEIQPHAVTHSEDFMSATLTFNSPVAGRVRCV